ncbi:protein ANKUB1 [Amia ocellicauda]|uniref:protein ANKUB1 n=1 Tax=Amia ocellicauda TaxID=2972642 RepID=UPI0034644F56
MRIFIAFEGLCEPFDISQDQTVRAVKLMIKDFFHVQLSDDRQVRRFLELSYAGACLQDNWVLADVGITPGVTLRCVLKEEDKPILNVFSAVTKETLPIMGNIFLLSTAVSHLKTQVSRQCGLPVSVFRLRTPNGVELYDCNRLDSYGIDVGATLHLDVWAGWKEFLRGCLLGHKHSVRHRLSQQENLLRFQQRVALYIAAFLGHLNLAGWLLGAGVRADEPVGVHPSREWCRDTDHSDVAKCPVHAAVEAGQLLILKLFLSSSVECLDCIDPWGHSLLQIAIRQRHKDTVLYLASKLWSVVSCPLLSLPLRTYVKIKRWLLHAQKTIASRKFLGRSVPFQVRVGDSVLVDGFTQLETRAKVKLKTKDVLSARVSGGGCVAPTWPAGCGLEDSSLPRNMRLPRLQPATRDRVRRRRSNNRSVRRAECPSPEDSERNQNLWKTKVPLPPISHDTNPRPCFIYASPDAPAILSSSLASFSDHSGRTLRENAIFCLALASSFTEKPWLQQLGVARTLARRTVQKIS